MVDYFEEVLMGVFANFPDDKRRFHLKGTGLHDFFWKYRDQYPILGTFGFENRGHYHWCRDINRAVGTLMICDLLRVWG